MTAGESDGIRQFKNGPSGGLLYISSGGLLGRWWADHLVFTDRHRRCGVHAANAYRSNV